MTLGVQVFFIRYGLADTVAGVVLVQLIPTVPYASLVMAASFASFDRDTEHALGKVLGAGPLLSAPWTRPCPPSPRAWRSPPCSRS